MSSAQERIWIIDRLEPGLPTYNIPLAVSFQGRLEVRCLERSLEAILRRHEILRTVFELTDEGAVQRVLPAPDRPVPVVDLRGLAFRDEVAQRLSTVEARRPFVLESGPLLRFLLLQLSSSRFILLLTVHHIVFDAWSRGILIRELGALYKAFIEGRPSPLPALPIQYADFAAWQKERLGEEALQSDLTYWRQRLAGVAPVLDLPGDRPRPAVQTHRGSRIRSSLSTSALTELQRFSRDCGATLFMLLLAAYQVLLSRYTGRLDMVVGSPIAGRMQVETEPLIGIFVNMLVLRSELSEDLSFRDFLSRFRKVVLEAFAHQEFPFEKLVEELQPERSLAHSPLFQVMFVLQNAPRERIEVPGLVLESLETEVGTSKFDLALTAAEIAGELSLEMDYDTDLYDGTSIARLLGHFRILLENALKSPETKLVTLPLLTPAETQQLREEWCDTKVSEVERAVHALVEAQAARAPERVAVVFEDRHASSGELDRRADDLAARLRRLGVGAEVPVGLHLERSVEMAIALLGVLKAGGCYVPLDPEFPAQRLVSMVENAGVKVLVDNVGARGGCPVRVERRISLSPFVSRRNRGAAGSGPGGRRRQVDVEDTAYILHTSGSTGRPKGVRITHRSVVNFLASMTARPGLGREDIFLAVTTLSFDIAVLEIFLPLTTGARLVMAGPEVSRDGLRLADLLAASRANVMQATPATWRLLMDAGWVGDEHLKVLCGGEALPSELARSLLARSGSVWNLYGPTEATVWSSVDRLSGDGPPITIGRPIANTAVHLLDGCLDPVAIGVAGELCIGGQGLARGYFGAASLTAASFFPHPLAQEAGERLYRTGDQARRLRDGRIEYLGRKDQQVKVRGYRIELGEIEAALERHPGIAQAAAVVSPHVGDRGGLVAFLVAAAGPGAPAAAACRRWLETTLPAYMVPAHFVTLEALPLTPNGKVDRRALADQAPRRPERKSSWSGPRNPIEEKVVAVWEGVLGLSGLGIHDDFFALGGHSILATQVIVRLNQAFGVELALRDLFEKPTVAELSDGISAARRERRGLRRPPLERRKPRPGPRPLSFAQQRLWFLDQLEPGNPFYNLGLARRLEGRLEAAVLERALRELMRRHETLRTSIVESGGEPVQRIASEPSPVLEVVDLRSLPETRRRSVAKGQARRAQACAFDLTRGPLLRLTLFRLSGSESVLVLTIHHIVSDAWSLGILARDVMTLYSAYREGEPGPLPELPVQYADFAEWQRRWLQGRTLDVLVEAWRARLGTAHAPLELPSDRPRPAVQTHRGAVMRFRWSAGLGADLRRLGRESGGTLFVSLMAGFKTLLHRVTGRRDIAVGFPIANRTFVEVEELIGFFANTLVLRTELDAGMSFRELLCRVQELALEAYDCQDMPFERLVEALQPERSLSHTPLFQVMLVLQNAPWDAQQLPGLTAHPLEVDRAVARFDWTLSFTEDGDDLVGSLEYSTDLFDAATLRRTLGYLRRLLAVASVDPECAVADLPLLSSAQRRQILGEWNDWPAPTDGAPTHGVPALSGSHHLFEAQVARYREATALVFDRQQLTYRELDRRAQDLARRLRAHGVARDTPVAIYLERSLEMIVAILATLKAGGAYVPLNPEDPPKRLAFMLDDVGARLILTAGRRATDPCVQNRRTLRMDADSADLDTAGAAGRCAAPRSSGWDLAYVLFTSGSTGRPKGVGMSHEALVNLVRWQISASGLRPGARTLQFAAATFDVSFQEIFSTLGCGGTLVLISEAERRDTEALRRQIADFEISRLFLPVVVLQQLAEVAAERRRVPGALRQVITAGEQLRITDPVRQLFHALRRGRLENQYGPTESHVVTIWPLAADPRQWATLPGIGRPIPESRVRIASRGLRLQPAGVPGELCIGGMSVARGYVRRPGLSAAQFVPDPFASAVPGSRLYRTGDLARFLTDGSIEFLGRIDHQIKVRGFRVESEDIEVLLSRHPEVRQAAIATFQAGSAGARLVAYVVPVGERMPPVGELRRFLARDLPAYLLPSLFVCLDALPMTSSGKVDRRALPEPRGGRPDLEQAFVAPETEFEEMLAAIWSQILDVDQVGRHDNFFDLGGHSLIATRVMSKIREVFRVELPVRRIFEAPTLSALAVEVGQAVQRGASRLAAPILPVSREAPLPLSFAQQRLWFLDQLEPGGSTYNIPTALLLRGDLQLGALEAGVEEILRRHEVLRTTFRFDRDRPVQVVADAVSPAFQVVDLGALPGADRQRETERQIAREATRAFDLATGPLFRVCLFRRTAMEQVLFVNMHHIVSDGWSMGIVVREVATLYEAFSQGRPSPLAPLRIQYSDFAAWQRSWLQGETLEKQLTYWREQLAGMPPVLELPSDRPRPAARGHRWARHSLRLPAQVSASLTGLSRQEGTTLFMALLGAFQVLLSRYTGSLDVVVGSPIAHRNREEIEPLIGFFVNTLVLRTDLSGNPSFRGLLGRVREVCLGAYACQDLPFERLVEELEPERHLGRTPLFQVMFMLQNAPRQSMELPGLQISSLEAGAEQTKFDLSLTATEAGEEFLLSQTYDPDLFDQIRMARMLEQFRTLLASAVGNPSRRISELPLLLRAERAMVLSEWNDTRAEFPGVEPPCEALLHELVEAQAERIPEAIAVVFDERCLSFRELDARAGRLANELSAAGAGPEVRVGIAMERSLELMPGLLAILKAGSAYVPIDPSYPRERIAFMLDDSRVSILLTQKLLLDRLPETSAQLVVLDESSGAEGRSIQKRPGSRVDPGNVAYMIYTSGSTGRPKGSVIAHRGICNRLLWIQQVCRLTPWDRILQKTPMSFDVSVWEFFWPLLAGARLVMARPEGHQDSAYLVELMASQEITTLHFVPPMLQAFLEESGLERCAGLARVICSGDALPFELQERFFNLVERADLYNLYGPTEAAVEVTCWRCRREGGPHTVPIGRPIANTRIHLLDHGGYPVPIGVVGELHIGGIQLARGYLSRPALTAEKFVPDALGDPGDRLYQTGDLARTRTDRTDGTVEFLGRIDHQIKVRGFRVESGEVEVFLSRHPEVRQAAVAAFQAGSAGARLVAYVVPAGERMPPVGELRGFLAQELPAYMLPSLFICLDALPVTSSGKVDRRALPEPRGDRPDLDQAFVAPQTEFEEMLAGIWSHILNVGQVGRHDNFFDLGGHSLLAIRVVSKIREVFNVELPVRRIFEAPTLSALAVEIGHSIQRGSSRLAPPILPVSREAPLPLSFAQQRLWFLNKVQPDDPSYNISRSIGLRGPLSFPALVGTLSEIVRRHEVLRTVFPSHESRPVQRILDPEVVRIPQVDLGGLAPDRRLREIERWAAAEARRPFDLAHGPLLRAILLRRTDVDHVGLFTLHHIVSDGWSSGLFAREVGVLYNAFMAGQPSPLQDLPIQYVDFAQWQRRWLEGDVLEQHLAYWRQQLDGAPPVLDVPTDRPRLEGLGLRGAIEVLTLDRSLGEAVSGLGRGMGATLFMTLLAIYQIVLSRFSGQREICVGTPIAGRSRLETENLIGCFVNTLVLRSDLSGRPSFQELLGRVRNVALEALSYQELPFDTLVQELQPDRSTGRTPLFQAVLAVQNPQTENLELPSLELAPLALAEATTPFELVLTFSESEEGLRALLRYAKDVFDRPLVLRVLRGFERLLKAAVEEPLARISELPILSEAESAQLLSEWNDTATDHGPPACLHQLFDRRAVQHPERIALAGGDHQLSYGELRARSDRLAERLRRQGVGPEVRVGVCLDRCPEMVAALLAVLKAGGAYVPLDPELPVGRRRFMVADAGVRLLLTLTRFTARLATPAEMFALDGEGGGAEPRESRATSAGDLSAVPGNLAYVIYTSGSTGRPKGVGVTHRSIANRLLWMQRLFPLDGDDKLLFKTPFSFDASIWEIFVPLFAGARLVVAEPAGHRDPAYLIEAIAQRGITVLQLVPSMLAPFLDQPGVEDGARSLKRLFCGGEALPDELSRRAGERLRTVVCNLYGPTEASIDATFQVRSAARTEGRIQIGRPYDNVGICLIDRAGRLVPRGAPGEILISGPGLARGYLGRPALTAERFVPFGESAAPGERMYRTGDVARHRADGTVEFLGRIDHQVKVRGYRIELGEVEADLLAQPGVSEAMVVVREDRTGQARLVAYLVARGTVTVQSLREALGEQLPDYMVPSAFFLLEELPRLPNGKVDRQAVLPLSEQLPHTLAPGPAPSATASVAPRSNTEEMVAAVWSDMLAVERIGIHDDFFEMGGHSLVALQVTSRLHKLFQVELPMTDIFQWPSVAELAARIDQALKAGESSPTPPLERAPRDGHLPLSFAQQRLWFLQQLEPESPAYNVPGALRLSGLLNSVALERALDAIVRCHESLRTNFQSLEGEAYQVISSSRRAYLSRVDLGDIPASRRQKLAHEITRREALRPFDLARQPLLRLLLFRLDRRLHILFFNLHHIISDGWSSRVLVRELSTRYRALVLGEPTAEPELPIQYADYACWQRQWFEGPILEAQLAYWRKRLEGAPPVLELVTDRPRPRVPTLHGGNRGRILPSVLRDGLQKLGSSTSATLFMTLLAGFKTLLRRYGAGDDVVVGTHIANRHPVETEPLIGFFINALVLRTDFSGAPSFRQALDRVRETALGAFAHSEMPFDKLVDELQPRRTLSAPPLFQAAFEMNQTDELPQLELPGLSIEPLPVGSTAPKLDLLMSVNDLGDQLHVTVGYSADLFDGLTIERMLGHFEELLEGAVADPDCPLDRVPLAVDPEIFRRSPVDLGSVETLPELFAAQVARSPDEVAVVFRRQRWTFRELDQRSATLAAYLRGLGVGPEVRVGVCMERGAGMIISLLGILKAGGGYVPLDPEYPAKRRAFMLEDAGTAVVLAEERSAPELQAAGRHVVCLDRDQAEIASAAGQLAGSCGARPENLAYVIYTSGSTGRPKGVLVSHRAIANRLLWMQRSFPIGSGDAVLQKTPLSFDASIWEIFVPLFSGARLVLAEPGGHRDCGYLLSTIRRDGVTVLQLVPSMLSLLLEQEGLSESCSGLKRLYCGGETLSSDVVKRFWDRLPETSLCNFYGATEASIDSTFHMCVRGVDGRGSARVPIGLPLSNAEVYLLGAHGELVPPGLAGEPHIAGPGLAREYLGRAGTTAARFVPHSWSAASGDRLYRTGDLARQRGDGALEFLQRIDAQVKLRGYRIEPGEVESVLRRQRGVREAAVVLREDSSGEGCLAAYVVSDELTLADLRRQLKTVLPDFMVPSELVALAALPRLPSGKLDRRALPVPSSVRPEPSEGGRPSSDRPTEVILAAIWGQVLGIEQIGAHDNFFELGGHSLTATRVVSRVRKKLEVELPLRSLFEAPTLAELAAVIDRQLEAGSGVTLPPLEPAPRGVDSPLSFAQQRLWLFDQLQPESPAYSLPQALGLAGRLDVLALRRAVEETFRHQTSLRTVFVSTSGGPVQRIRPAVAQPLPQVDLSALGETQSRDLAARLARQDARRPFDLQRGPLLRLSLLCLGPREYVLLVNMHHIISDAWSMGVLVRELTFFYGAFSRGEEPHRRDLPIQYVDFAHWQRQWLEGPALEAQLSYWRRQLEGAPALMRLPTDYPRPKTPDFRGGSESVAIPREVHDRLRQLCRVESCTLFMMILATFQTLLHHLTGDDDLVVGAPVNYRHWLEVENLIGFFINMLVFRNDLSGSPTFRELLGKTSHTALLAYAHQHLPFDRLVEELRPERNLNHNPLFQVALTVLEQGATLTEEPVEEIEVFAIDSQTEVAQFDLTLNVVATDNGLRASISYKRSLFEGRTIAYILEKYKWLLEWVTEDPDISLRTIRERFADADVNRRKEAEGKIEEASRRKPMTRKRRTAVRNRPDIRLEEKG